MKRPKTPVAELFMFLVRLLIVKNSYFSSTEICSLYDISRIMNYNSQLVCSLHLN